MSRWILVGCPLSHPQSDHTWPDCGQYRWTCMIRVSRNYP